MLQGGKAFDYFSGILPCEAQLVQVLQIEPEFRCGAKEMAKAQRCVAGNGPPIVQNLRNPVRGHAEVAAEFCGTHGERAKLFG